MLNGVFCVCKEGLVVVRFDLSMVILLFIELPISSK